MPNGNSPQMQIPLMAENDTLKYLLNNDGFNALDNAFNRILDVDMTSGDVTLTESQFTRNVTFRCENHTVTRTLTVPSTVGSAPVITVNRFFIVVNDGTGDVNISGGAGTNQAVGPSSSALVVADGTDVYLISRFVEAREYREEGVNQITDPEFVNFIGANVTAAANSGGVDVTIVGVTTQDDSVTQVSDTAIMDFTGGGVTVTPSGSTATVNIPGTAAEDEGIQILASPDAFDFIGTYVSVAANSGTAEVTIGGLDVEEEGVSQQTDPTFINFIGSGVTAAASGNGVDVTIVTGEIDIADEGVTVVTAATDFDFVGDGVSVTSPSAGSAQIEILAPPLKAFKGALVSLTSDQTISATTNTAIDWEATDYDYGGWADIGGANPERLTVPDGVTRVRVTANVSGESTTDQLVLSIFKNGALVAGGGQADTDTTGGDNVNVKSAVLEVVPTDYFTAIVYTQIGRDIVANASTFFAIEAVNSATDTYETEGRSLGFAGWNAPGNIFTALNSGTPSNNAHDAADDSWFIETIGDDGVGFAYTSTGITGGADFDVVFALRGRLPNDADAEIGVFYGNNANQDRSVFLIDEAGQFRHDFYNTNTTFGSTNATDAVGRVYNDFPRHGVFYMRLTNTSGTTSMQFSSDGLDWHEVFAGTDTENTMTDIDEVGLFFNSANLVAGEVIKLRCVGYDINGPQNEIITGLNAHRPLELNGTAEVAASTHFLGNRTLYIDNAAAITYTINTGITGTEPVVIVQEGAGQITVTAGASVTLKTASSAITRGQYAHIVVTPDKFNANTYYVSGDLQAV